MPLGSHLAEFIRPPSKVHARNAEGQYWLRCSEQLCAAFPSARSEGPANATQASDATRPAYSSLCLEATDACAAASRQKAFFKGMGARVADPDVCKRASSLDRNDCGQASLEKLRSFHIPSRRSPTAVLDAAFFLIEEGMSVRIPKEGFGVWDWSS